MKNINKRTIIICALIILLAIPFYVYGVNMRVSGEPEQASPPPTAAPTDTTPPTESPSATPPPATTAPAETTPQASGQVAISGIRKDADYKGNTTVIVSCQWTNSGSEDLNFMNLYSVTVSQGGGVCEQAVYLNGVYSDSMMAAIKPGESMEVENAYKLLDSSQPVSVGVAQRGSNEALASETYDIASL